jgi:seryl-tRNA synthetase
VQEPQPPAKNVGSTNPKKTNLGRSIAKLEADLRHNQRQIEQLQEQNAKLTQKIQAMSRKRPPDSTSATSSGRISDRRRPKRNASQKFWLSMGLISMCIAIVCALIGFALMRLLTVK